MAVPATWRNRPLALCLSGGCDSSALAFLATREGMGGFFPSIEALHVRHHLRGVESQGDADSVHELCGRLGIPLRILDAPVDSGPGLEARAREERYRALRRASPGAILATAHHRDDQAETVVLRLLRGAHVRGLAGIKAWRDDGIWRPLLGASRVDLERVCREAGWTPRTDSSNTDRAFHRNGIRLDLLPAWEEREPGVVEALASLAEEAGRLAPLLDRALDRLEDHLGMEVDERGFSLRLDRLEDAANEPELLLLLDRAWSRLGRRPWAGQQLSRLLADASRPAAGRRSGGQGEEAVWGGGRLRIELVRPPGRN